MYVCMYVCMYVISMYGIVQKKGGDLLVSIASMCAKCREVLVTKAHEWKFIL